MGIAELFVLCGAASLGAALGLWLGVALVGARLIREDMEAEGQE